MHFGGRDRFQDLSSGHPSKFFVFVHACMHACMYVGMYVCVCMYACMYVMCSSVYVCMLMIVAAHKYLLIKYIFSRLFV